LNSWKEVVDDYSTLFGEDFVQKFGSQIWMPTAEDANAAAELHIQLVSRIATQALIYRAGVETAALNSVFQLFGLAREIATKYPLAKTFDCIIWHVVNSQVRPFTAKWHRKGSDGALDALDETDSFRSELTRLQKKLVLLDSLLIFMRDGVKQVHAHVAENVSDIVEEMRKPLVFGIPIVETADPKRLSEQINLAEREAILARRMHYGLPNEHEATGLAISGGGIRSATFALGILVALSKRNLLFQFDYLSTVSGGGFVGSFLTTFLSGSAQTSNIGLGNKQEPFAQVDGEGTALRRIRHMSRYLQASTWERLALGFAQIYGMTVNICALAVVPLMVGLLEYWARPQISGIVSSQTAYLLLLGLFLVGLILPGLVRSNEYVKPHIEKIYLLTGSLIIISAAWWLLGVTHLAFSAFLGSFFNERVIGGIVLIVLFPLSFALASSVCPLRFRTLRNIATIVAGLAAPITFVGIELVAYAWLASNDDAIAVFGFDFHYNSVCLVGLIVGIYLFIWRPLDINFTAPHRHYKRKLAEAFLIRKNEEGELVHADILLSEAVSTAGPYHLINASLNVPSSKNPAMQGRLTDFFLFSPAYCGSPSIGYFRTLDWERVDPELSIATAMAISGAAASPLMGLSTKLHITFWMSLLNVRLGYWAKHPVRVQKPKSHPGPLYLAREMLGRIDERKAFLNLTDGGHIENLGVFELLRRRCKFIVAIDGEFDPNMTFHALTNLQRLASIDLGVDIDVDLNDLRLDSKNLSRSHFQLCRIKYPAAGDAPAGIGYILYIKLSLTGNEGEFIRRHRMDEPEFPHHSTANQFFSESQFEAYRSLGEHIGERLFDDALAGDVGFDVSLKTWFEQMGTRMLDSAA
jgi:MFS family permease